MVDKHEVSQVAKKWEPIIETLGSFDQEKTNFLAVYAENPSRYDNERTIDHKRNPGLILN